MKTVFVAGCFDPLHAGHVRFLRFARRLAPCDGQLVVSIVSDEEILRYKHRKAFLPVNHRVEVLEALVTVNRVMVSADGCERGKDFYDNFREVRPDILAVTEDDQHRDDKRALCAEVGARYHVIRKDGTWMDGAPTSSTMFLTDMWHFMKPYMLRWGLTDEQQWTAAARLEELLDAVDPFLASPRPGTDPPDGAPLSQLTTVADCRLLGAAVRAARTTLEEFDL